MTVDERVKNYMNRAIDLLEKIVEDEKTITSREVRDIARMIQEEEHFEEMKKELQKKTGNK